MRLYLTVCDLVYGLKSTKTRQPTYQNICWEYLKDQSPGIFLPFLSQGQGPVEYGKISFQPSKLGKLDFKRTRPPYHNNFQCNCTDLYLLMNICINV